MQRYRLRMRLQLLLLVGSIAPSVDALADTRPSDQTVLAWLGSTEQVRLGQGKPIWLASGERAILMPAAFLDRGRNFSRGIILVRPKLRSAQEIEGISGDQFDTVRSKGGGPSLVAMDESASGQGTIEGRMMLYTFDGWHPTTLLKTEYNSNLGYCGPPTQFSCESTEVRWRFSDKNGTGVPDIVETKVVASGPDPDRLVRKKMVTKYSYVSGQFHASK